MGKLMIDGVVVGECDFASFSRDTPRNTPNCKCTDVPLLTINKVLISASEKIAKSMRSSIKNAVAIDKALLEDFEHYFKYNELGFERKQPSAPVEEIAKSMRILSERLSQGGIYMNKEQFTFGEVIDIVKNDRTVIYESSMLSGMKKHFIKSAVLTGGAFAFDSYEDAKCFTGGNQILTTHKQLSCMYFKAIPVKKEIKICGVGFNLKDDIYLTTVYGDKFKCNLIAMNCSEKETRYTFECCAFMKLEFNLMSDEIEKIELVE